MRRLVFLTVSALIASLGVASNALPAQAGEGQPGSLVSDNPANFTPDVLNGRVYSIAKVGNTMIVGGTFTRVRNHGSQTALTREHLMAFDATTGRISTTFTPNPDALVRTVVSAGDGKTVYVGGSFKSVGGTQVRHLARVRVSDGSVVTGFRGGSPSGTVRDLQLSRGRLWVAGSFSKIDGTDQSSLATLDPQTGALDSFMSLGISGVHNGGSTNVKKFDINPAGTRLVAVGNFDQVGGQKDEQMLMLDLSGTSARVADFHTGFYESRCDPRWNSTVHDVDFSPDGSFFVISTTGTYGGGPPGSCDTSARWDTDQSGSDLRPSWVDYTGGDTQYAIEITRSVVYIGGHARWQNNPFARDDASQGAISRPGIAALDPSNGVPFSWNPTRSRGVGVFDLLATSQGLWVTSDTARIGHEQHERVALMPADGKKFPAVVAPTLPNDVYSAGPNGLVRRSYEAGHAGKARSVGGAGVSWDKARGAFMANGNVYTGWSNGDFTRRPFDGSGWGAQHAVDTSDQIMRLRDWHRDVSHVTGMFLLDGRLYFTRSGSSKLYYRYFTPESDAVGAQRFEASGGVKGIDFAKVRGMFNTGSRLYWATPDGNLHRMRWRAGVRSGAPVAGSQSVLSGPGIDGVSWSGRALFLYQDRSGNGAVLPPRARFAESCRGERCHFNASASTSPNGGVVSYRWDFGDGSSSSAESPTHSYASPGDYPVTLTVTDDTGASGSASRSLEVTRLAHSTTRARARSVRYGAHPRLRVTVTSTLVARGRVSVSRGHHLIRRARLHSGRAVIRLGRHVLRPGRHRLTVRYPGSHRVHRSSDRVVVHVYKASPRVNATVRTRRIHADRTHAKVRVHVRVRHVAVWGHVTARSHHRRIAKGRLHRGRVTLRLRRFHTRGWKNVRVRYHGSRTIHPRTVTVRLHVRR